jgi:WD40 repeat protein
MNPMAGRLAISAKLEGGKPWIESWSISVKPNKVTIETTVRVQSLSYSPDGRALAAGFEDGSVAWYDTASGKAIKQLTPLGKFTVQSVAFHPAGKYLACGTLDRGVPNLFLINVTSGEIVVKLLADANGVTSVCFSPNGDKLAAFGSSGTVTIWDATKLLKLERD